MSDVEPGVDKVHAHAGANRIADNGGPAWPFLLACFIWDINDASGPQAVPSAALFQVLVALIIGLGTIRLIRHGGGFVLPSGPVSIVLACLIIGATMGIFRDDFVFVYVASELGTMLFFVLAITYAAVDLPRLLNASTITWFCLLYSAIAVFAWFAASMNLRPNFYYGGRWDPPYFLLVVGLSLLARYAVTLRLRLGFAGLGIAMLVLSLYSGNRTQFLLSAILAGGVWASVLSVVAFGVLATLMLLLFSNGVPLPSGYSTALSSTRFSLLSGGADLSIQGRFAEVADIWVYLTERNSVAQTLFGRGLGALWQPISRTRLVLDAGGNIYYIHIGFVHMTYRYGVLGLITFVYWASFAAPAIRYFVGRQSGLAEKFWAAGAIGFVCNFFLQNSLYDPPVVLAMSALMVLVWTRSRSGGLCE